MSFYFPNVDPTYIYRRQPEDYIELTQNIIIKNARGILREIPNFATKVAIKDATGANLTESDINSTTLDSDEYKIDYTAGIVFTHESLNGSVIEAEYLGTGYVSFPSNRIVIDDGSTYPEITLQDMMDGLGVIEVSTLVDKVDEFNNQIKGIHSNQSNYEYYSNGDIKTVTEKDGLGNIISTETYSYDSNGDVSSSVKMIGGQVISTKYIYDSNGNIIDQTNTIS